MTSSDEPEKVLLGVLELFDAKRLKSILESKGIPLELVSQGEKPSAKRSGVTVEIYADPKHVPEITAHIAAERSKLLDDLKVNHELHEQTFDPEKETAICPACGTGFSTKLKECPDCGLVFLTE